jgi:hypothetical protein
MVEAPFGTMTVKVKRRQLPGGQGNDRKTIERYRVLRFMLLLDMREVCTGETELR